MYSYEDYIKTKQSYLLLLIESVRMLYGDFHLVVHQSVGQASYCTIKEVPNVDESMLCAIHEKMREIAKSGREFSIITKADGGTYARLAGEPIRIYHPTYPSAEGLYHFSLVKLEKGFLLRYFVSDNEKESASSLASYKLMEEISKYRAWCDLLGFDEISKINKCIDDKTYNEMIFVAEAYHERKFSHIADAIAKRNNVRIVLVSGPSSSGKTTFAARLKIHLKVNGIHATRISMDDYFYERDKTPKNADGSYNFEDLEALDYKLFNSDMKALSEGESVCLPRFNFQTGKREKGINLRLDERHIIIVEGIHALNHKICPDMEDKYKYKIYCTPFSTARFDDYSPVSPTNTRLLRRMVRDSQFRNSPPENTLSMWSSVRQGEIKNIFPFEESADAIFNSALVYEYCAIAPMAKKLLAKIGKESKYYGKAQELLHILSHFKEMPTEAIPPHSIMREFIGGSSL